MFDFENLGQYRDNNRIAAKKATGGLQESIWETYSAFADAKGGIILLGVIELEDKSLQPIDLTDPESLVMDFWEHVNDPAIASSNILTNNCVTIENIDGKRIVAIRVPRHLPRIGPCSSTATQNRVPTSRWEKAISAAPPKKCKQ